MIESLNFLYYTYPCEWQGTPDNLLFDASLNRFCNQVDYFCDLENEGRIISQEAYNQIKLALTELGSVKHRLIQEELG